jgi:hypothetical protein
MASPRLFTFFVLHGTTNLPATGLSPSFTAYKNDLGTNLTQPTITEIGGGLYKFTPVFSDPDRGIALVVSTGHNPAYIPAYLRPEEFNLDNLDTAVSSRASDAALSYLASAADMATALTGITDLGASADTLLSHVTADERVHTSGPNANRVVRYSGDDHMTELASWDLLAEDGTTPDAVAPFYRKRTA